jgi:hypothetical protein
MWILRNLLVSHFRHVKQQQKLHIIQNSITYKTLPSYIMPLYVSQEECARLREGVPYGKIYLYNSKHLCPKLTVTEIMAREKCGILAGLCTIGIS